jgi:hypothetical protein
VSYYRQLRVSAFKWPSSGWLSSVLLVQFVTMAYQVLRCHAPLHCYVQFVTLYAGYTLLKLSGLSSSSEEELNSAAAAMQRDKIGEAQRQWEQTYDGCLKRCCAVYLFGFCSFSTQQTKTLNHPKEEFMSQRCWAHTEVL